MAERKTTRKPAAKAAAKATRKPAAKSASKSAAKTAAAKTAAKSASKPAKKAAATKTAARTPAKAKTAGKAKPRVKPPPAQRRSKRTAVARSKSEAARDVALFDSLGSLRTIFAEHLVLTVERLQDALDDAVRHGRILPTDAQELGQRIAHLGRRQLEDLLAEVDKRRLPKK